LVRYPRCPVNSPARGALLDPVARVERGAVQLQLSFAPSPSSTAAHFFCSPLVVPGALVERFRAMILAPLRRLRYKPRVLSAFLPRKRMAWVLAVALLLGSITSEAGAQEPDEAAGSQDPRQLVSMPAAAQRLLREDMLDHMMVLNQIFAHLAADEFREASDLAESRMGNSSKGRHRAAGMGPGRFMPPEMRSLGMGMHQAASDFAAIVVDEKPADAYAALQRLTGFCVACHASFRTR